MSGKTHNRNVKHPEWRFVRWMIPIWLGLLILVAVAARWGGAILDRLAAGDPDSARRARVDGLRVTRALLAKNGEAGKTLWEARGTSGTAGFFWGGAVRAERLGRKDEARQWLAMELLRQGRKEEARAMLASVPTSAPLALPELGDWENSELGNKLRESLGR